MKNNTKIAFLIILAAAAFSTLAFVIWPTLYVTNEQVTSQPDQVVQGFYAEYLSYDGNPLVDKVYRSSEYLSPDMIAFLDEFTRAACNTTRCCARRTNRQTSTPLRHRFLVARPASTCQPALPITSSPLNLYKSKTNG